MAEIVLDHVTKVFADGTVAVDELDLHVTDGEFMVLVGPSGCGKTTALRMVAGLEQVTGGDIRIGGAVVNDLTPRERDIAMVFQSYALYPQMTVYQNMAFGLKLGHVDKDEIDRRVRESARTLGLEPLLDRKPRTLSGGQRQRVAMGRAIVRNPQAFLMDEPLSNLDAKLRVHMRVEIARLQQELAVTTLYVTHDQVEAMTMGDRVAVLRQGRLQQVGTPTELFDRPTNLFVGGFIGTPSMNLFRARLERHGDELRARVGEQSITLDPQVLADRPALLAWADRDVAVGIRPHDFALVDDRSAGLPALELCVDLVEELGTETLVHLDLDAPPLDTDEVRELTPDTDALSARADAGRTDAIAAVRAGAGLHRGDTVHLTVDTRRMHFFDPSSGEGVYG